MIDARVILLEGDAKLQAELLSLLQNEVSEVIGFASPLALLETVENGTFDILITEIDLPDIDLFSTLEGLKKKGINPPVVLISNFDDKSILIQSIKHKIENFVTKPINIDNLLENIQAVNSRLHYQKELQIQQELLDQYKHIVDTSTNISITDINGIITYVNDNFCELSGYSREELIGVNHNIMRDNSSKKELFEEMWETLLQKKPWQGIIKNRRKDGSAFFVDTTISPLLWPNGEIKEFISIKMDITKMMMQNYYLERDVITDRLTDLPNRLSLQSAIKHLDGRFEIMLINLDKFRETNMLFGLQFGDNVLMSFANSLLACANIGGLKFYRLAADEFLVMYNGPQEKVLETFYENLKEYIEHNPFTYREITFDLEFTCIILTCNNGDYSMVEQLQKLMADAKRKRVALEIYKTLPDDTTEYKANFEWTKKIKSALQDNRMELFFQPIYDLNLQRITKYESLIRLVDTDGSVVSPVYFLKAAKHSKHYKELTTLVITQVCERAMQSDTQFSINLSIEDLTDDETLSFLINRVRECKLAHKIIIEVLESEGIDNFELVSSALERLKAENLEIAIDDFGSGYSNFSYLTKLPIDILKIDGSLIQNIATDSSSKVLVQSIILFAHELGMRCVAEFVRDKEIYEIVKSMGVDFIQGYYIAAPSRDTNLEFNEDF
jgi:PAS domain S-box-containing protein/diguanylate cyclase (GGDEF)-like protein